MAMRNSSVQSMSSGLAVTSPHGERGVGVQRLAGLGAHRVQGRLLVVEAAAQAALAGHHRVEAEVGLGHGDLRCPGRVVRQRQLVAAVAGQGQLQEAAGEAASRLDQREQAARRNIEAAERAAQQADGLAHQPVVLVREQRPVHRQHGSGVALRLDEPHPDVELVGAHRQDGVFQFACQGQRVPGGAGGFDGGDVGRLRALRALHGEDGGALGAIDLDGDVRVAKGVGFHGALQRRQRDALASGRPVAALRQLQRAFAHLLRKHGGLGDVVHQAPVLGLLAAHAFGRGAEDVGQVMAHMALVGHAGQAAGAGQHAQQRHFGQADGAGAVVHQDDLVAGQRQLVAAARAGAVHGGEELQARVLRRVFQAVARLVGELAEVHLPGMGGDAEHEDVGARAEHLFLGAGHHDRAHLRVLEADAVDGVVQLDVDAQVVAVELELVAGAQARVLVEVRHQRGDRAVESEFPVVILGRISLVVDSRGSVQGILLAKRTIVHEMVRRQTNNSACS